MMDVSAQDAILAGQKPREQVFVSVQVLRGLAALMVVANHLLDMAHDRLGAPQSGFQLGNAGVDIFFCISGFIMVVTTAHAWGRVGLWKTFLARRFIRVFPLYWLLTLLKIGATVAAPGVALHKGVSVWYDVASLLLIPAWDPSHQTTHPLLVVGWTLSFEILFYGVFALALARSQRPIFLAGFLMLAGAALSLVRNDSWPPVATLLDPILLEFIFGMALGYLTVMKWKLPRPMALAAVVVAVGIYALSTTQDVTSTRFFWWGVPGCLIVASGLSFEELIRDKLAGLPKLAGDASYSVYLSHGFVLVPVGILMAHSHLHGAVLWWAAGVVGLVAALIGGIVVYKFVEVPLTGFVKRLTPVR